MIASPSGTPRAPPGQKSFWTSTTKSAGLRPMVPFPPFQRFAKRLRLGRIARNPRRNPHGRRGRPEARRTTVVLGRRDLGEGYRTRLGRRTEGSSRGEGVGPAGGV